LDRRREEQDRQEGIQEVIEQGRQRGMQRANRKV